MLRKALLILFIASAIFADVVIFVYHRFGDTRHPSTNISIEKLRTDFNWLKANGYKVMSMEEITTYLKEKKEFPKKAVAFNIDDSYKSFYKNGLPIFKEFGFPFTLFVCTHPAEKKYGDYMTWEEINDTKKYGEVSFHTHTHPHMTTMSDTKIRQELKSGVELFTKRVGEAPKYFAYPYGEYDERVAKISREFGFEAIMNQSAGAVNRYSDIYDIDRSAVGENTKMKIITRLKHLPIRWNIKRSKNNLDIIEGFIDKKIKKIEVYVSGYGWERVNVENGKFTYNFSKPLKLTRSRVIVKTYDHAQGSLLLMKQ